IATGEEIMSTRGRANIIRAALALRTDGHPHRRATARAPLLLSPWERRTRSASEREEVGLGEGRVSAFEYGDPLKSAELDAALSNCLSCKGCTPECPSNVNLALLKAEMLYARHKRDGLPLRERIFSSVDLLGQIGCTLPWLFNAVVDFAPIRGFVEKMLGISAK